MASKLKNITRAGIRWLIPLGLTILLVWALFRKVNFTEMMQIIRNGCDYWWILAAMGLSIVSHIVRAARWRLQLRSLGIRPPFPALCCSIFGCYALNLVFPRLGEIWRVTYISRREKAPFTTILGSLVSDRLADTAMVGLLTLLTFVVANRAINDFLEKYPVGQDAIRLLSSPLLWIAGIAFAVLIAGILWAYRKTSAVGRLLSWLRQVWEGFASVGRMKGKWAFLMLTIGIWGCYYFQLYLAFFAFPFTRNLCSESSLAFGLTPCLLAFVLSSIGMAIPSQGGLGPWNIAIMFGLAVYGINETEGAVFSILQWSGQTVMLIILGIYTMAYIASSRRNSVASTILSK
ncbi:MAG: flippase-like domain-containing protein [Muribaculaceae bacterium]|nr:flippase-like domain-containing protein [Muribaculaceae bacterium]